MAHVVRQVPVDAVLHVPFPLLGKLLAHEHQLLAGERKLPGVHRLQLAQALRLGAGSLHGHGTFPVDHFIMTEDQDIVFRESIVRDMGQRAVVPFAVHRVQLEVAKGIVHPAHVPFEGETETAVADVLRDAPFRGGILGDQVSAGTAADFGIQLAHEIHTLQVHPPAEHIGPPVIPVIVVIQHGSHRVHPKGVDMELPDPVDSVGNQEGTDLRLRMVKGQGSPDREFPAERIAAFIQRRPIKPGHGKAVLRKMGRHPVQDHTDAGLMHFVDEGAEIVRRSVAAGRGVVSGDLVSPGQVKGMLADAHELNMGVAHILHILHKIVRQLGVIQETVLVPVALISLLPGAEMHLIDRHGLFQHLRVVPLILVIPVIPLIGIQRIDDRRAGGAPFEPEGIGIGFVPANAVGAGDHIAVGIPGAHLRQETFPDASVPHASAHPLLVFPTGFRADDGDILRVGRPDGETGPGHAVHHIGMGAQFLINLVVGSLMEQEAVEFAEYTAVFFGHCRILLEIIFFAGANAGFISVAQCFNSIVTDKVLQKRDAKPKKQENRSETILLPAKLIAGSKSYYYPFLKGGRYSPTRDFSIWPTSSTLICLPFMIMPTPMRIASRTMKMHSTMATAGRTMLIFLFFGSLL